MELRRKRFSTALICIAISVSSLLTIASSNAVSAKEIKCGTDEVSVPDDRPGGGNLCMKKSEWEKAKEICKKHGQSDPMQCVCQDGDTVGACGD